MGNSNLHDKHRERMRERYLSEGMDGFQPHQILELILFYVIPRKDTNELAHQLLNRFGSISNVFEATPKELMKVDGIGKSAAVFLNMFSQIRRVYDADKLKQKNHINSTKDAGMFCTNLFLGRIYENFFVISLNSQNKIINTEKLCEGTADETVVYPKSIARIAIQNNAVKIIVTHNHPGGGVDPSTEDISITTQIKTALDVIGVTLEDHVIVADDKYYSFREHKII